MKINIKCKLKVTWRAQSLYFPAPEYRLSSLYRSVVEHWYCKPGVESLNLSGGKDYNFPIRFQMGTLS
jgi:hypothetical protein